MNPIKTYLLLPMLLSIAFTGKLPTAEQTLFPYYENHRTGFINARGETVIKAVFRDAGGFSEGLAPARINGTYGYIDYTGKFIIEPAYDYALEFSEGFAVVFRNAKPFYINRQGEQTPKVNFETISPFHNGRARVQTAGGKQGYIDPQGRLIIDTVFSEIGDFVHGVAIVKLAIPDETGKNKYTDYKQGMIDSLGTFVVPYGMYSYISYTEGDYFLVESAPLPDDTIEGDTKKTGFVDRTGKLIFEKSHRNNSWIDGSPNCGLVKMQLYKRRLSQEDYSYTTALSYEGFVNLEGEYIVNDTNYKRVHDFSDNRAFVEDDNNNLFIIDRKGKKIVQESFESTAGERFHKGVAFVRKGGKYGMIDTNGTFLIAPKYKGIDECGLVGNYFFTIEGADTEDDYAMLFGIERKDGTTLLKPVMQDFDRNGFQQGILRCVIDGKYSLLSESGEIVWQQTDKKGQPLSNLNTDVMNRGYFYAWSKPEKHGMKGFGGSDNIPKPIARSQHFPEKALSLIVTAGEDTIFKSYHGLRVYIANTTKKTVRFSAQDSRLYMKVQALDPQGQWRDIEYLPGSWCGNSYHTLSLEPKTFWSFVTPVYEGDFQTKLRIELTYIHPSDISLARQEKARITLYSNEYNGSINPGQLWRKNDYYPQGIMDPYND